MNGFSRGLLVTILLISGVLLVYLSVFTHNGAGIPAGLALVGAAGFTGIGGAIPLGRKDKDSDDH